MKDIKDVERLLSEINQKLDVMVACQRIQLRKILKENYLTTENRVAIYNLFDGNHSLEEIAKKVNITREAVRQLKVALEVDSLITINKIGKKEYPKKLI